MVETPQEVLQRVQDEVRRVTQGLVVDARDAFDVVKLAEAMFPKGWVVRSASIDGDVLNMEVSPPPQELITVRIVKDIEQF